MPRKGVLSFPNGIFCAACFALAAAWPSQEAQANDDSQDDQRVVAIATERIERGKRQVHVVRGDEPVELPRFTELIVVRAANRELSLEKLLGQRVAIVNSLKSRGQWEVYADGVGAVGLALAENIFQVKRVVASSRESPVRVRLNGTTVRLKPGQVLLVLG